MDQLMQANAEALLAVDDIGEKIVESLQAYFMLPENAQMIEDMTAFGLSFEAEKTIQSSTVFEGQIIVVSGVFAQKSRNELKQMIEDNGGKVGSSISSKTTFVLAGESMGPSKKDKANQLGIPMISETAFYEML